MNYNFPKENIGNRVELKFKYNSEVENAFKGVILIFTKEIVGNIDDRAEVKVTSSPVNYVCIAKN